MLTARYVALMSLNSFRRHKPPAPAPAPRLPVSTPQPSILNFLTHFLTIIFLHISFSVLKYHIPTITFHYLLFLVFYLEFYAFERVLFEFHVHTLHDAIPIFY